MSSIRNNWRRRLGRQLVVRIAVPSLILGSLGVTLSTFVSTAAKAASLAAGVPDASDANGDTTRVPNWGTGTNYLLDPRVFDAGATVFTGGDPSGTDPVLAGKVKDTCNPIGSGSPPSKVDFEQAAASDPIVVNGQVYEYMAFTRAAAGGDSGFEFEFDKSTTACANSPLRVRADGDFMVELAFGNAGPSLILARWDSTLSDWVVTTLPATAVQFSASDDGLYGEMVVNLTAAGVFSNSSCTSYGYVTPTSSASGQGGGAPGQDEVKDFIPGRPLTVSNCGTIVVDKTDDAGKGLAGATFGLYTDNPPTNLASTAGNDMCTTTLGPAGPSAPASCSFGDVLPGTYYVAEISAPNGYSLDPAVTQVTASAGTTSTVSHTYSDLRDPGKVALTKTDDTGAPLNGAEFGIFSDAAASTTPAPVQSGGNNTCTTASLAPVSSGSGCTFTGLLPGTYYVKELQAPAGYQPSAVIATVAVTSDQTTTIPNAFVDLRDPGRVTVNKTDDLGNGVDGATFGLFATRTSTTPITTCTTSGGGTAVPATCTMFGILPGTYYVKETQAPPHYALDPTVVSVAVSSDQTTTISTPFVDNRNPGSVTLTKTDDTGAPLNGAEFGLYSDAKATVPASTPGGNNACMTVGGSAGPPATPATCTFNNVPPGTYYVAEIFAPQHYSTDTHIVPVAVSSDSVTTVPTAFVDPRRPGSVSLTKVDDVGAGVNGAVFGIFTDAKATQPAPVSAGGNNTCTTSGGSATAAASCTLSGLTPGAYYVAETSAPQHYAKDSTIAPVTVTSDTVFAISAPFVDPRNPGSVSLTKVDDAGAGVNGAAFGIFTDAKATQPAPVSASGNNTCTTSGGSATAAASCRFSGLTPGAYYVAETRAPTGYTADAGVQSVTVTSDATTAVAQPFVDSRLPSSILVTKAVNGNSTTTATNPLVVETGSQLTYLITVTNTGQLPLTITSLTDTLHANLPASCTQALNSTLAVQASFTCTYTATASGDAHNVAAAAGIDQFGRTPSGQAETFVHVLQPAIALAKTGPAQAHVGDTLTYTLTVTNPGNAPLATVAVTDDKCANAPVLQSKTGGNQDNLLDPGETWTYTCTYVVKAGDGTSVVNHAGVAGADPLGTMVTASSQWTTTVLHPAITIKKTANPTSVTNSGPVTYTYVVTNTGDVTLTNVAVTDNVIGPIGTIGTLAPGASATLTKTVTVTTSTPPTNIGTASGTDPLGKTVTATDQATISVVLGEVITPPAAPAVAPETLPRTGAPLQGEAEFGFVLFLLGGLLVVWGRRARPADNGDGR